MARQRERQLGGGNSAPSSRTRVSRTPPGFDLDFDAVRAGVEAVLDQLLDDGSRPLDDFAGGDLIDEVVVEDADRHGRAVLARQPASYTPAIADVRGYLPQFDLRCRLPALPASRRAAARRVPSGALP